MIFSRRISAAQRKERGGPGEGVSHGAPAVGKYLIYHACHWRGGREGSKRASGVGKRESVLPGDAVFSRGAAGQACTASPACLAASLASSAQRRAWHRRVAFRLWFSSSFPAQPSSTH